MSNQPTQTLAGLPIPQKSPSAPNHVMDLFSMKGKVVSITGSSTGIGLTVAEAMCQAGADVCIWYNSHSSEETAKKFSEKYGVKCKAYKCKITDSKQVNDTVQQQKKEFGKIDAFIANAGVPWTGGPMIDLDDNDEMWHKVVDIDLNGVYYAAKAIGKVFKEQGHGSLVCTASMSGIIVNGMFRFFSFRSSDWDVSRRIVRLGPYI